MLCFTLNESFFILLKLNTSNFSSFNVQNIPNTTKMVLLCSWIYCECIEINRPTIYGVVLIIFVELLLCQEDNGRNIK